MTICWHSWSYTEEKFEIHTKKTWQTANWNKYEFLNIYYKQCTKCKKIKEMSFAIEPYDIQVKFNSI